MYSFIVDKWLVEDCCELWMNRSIKGAFVFASKTRMLAVFVALMETYDETKKIYSKLFNAIHNGIGQLFIACVLMGWRCALHLKSFCIKALLLCEGKWRRKVTLMEV